MAVPGRPGPYLVVVEPELVLGGLVVLLDVPAQPRPGDHRGEARVPRGVGEEVREVVDGSVVLDDGVLGSADQQGVREALGRCLVGGGDRHAHEVVGPHAPRAGALRAPLPGGGG